jgi:ankyrin repeat protein
MYLNNLNYNKDPNKDSNKDPNKDLDWDLSGPIRSYTRSLKNVRYSEGLRIACHLENIELAKQMISLGADNILEGFIIACHNRNMQLTKLLYDHYRNNEHEESYYDRDSISTMHEGLNEVCISEDIEFIDFLLGLASSRLGYYLHILLSSACYRGKLKVAEYTVQRYSKVVNEIQVGETNYDNLEGFLQSVKEGLITACCQGHIHLAELMIANGADNFNQAMVSACTGNHAELVKLMIKHNANNFQECFNALINVYRYDYEHDPYNSIVDIIKILIDNGGITSINDYNKALNYACGQNDYKLAKLMLSLGEYNKFSLDVNSGLYSACKEHNYRLAKLMLSNGANDIRICMHHTMYSDELITRLLLDHGAVVDNYSLRNSILLKKICTHNGDYDDYDYTRDDKWEIQRYDRYRGEIFSSKNKLWVIDTVCNNLDIFNGVISYL